MGAVKREAERLGDIVIYGNAETMAREFQKVIDHSGGANWIAGAVEMARYIAPLCECGADYHAELLERFPQWIQDTNEQAAAK